MLVKVLPGLFKTYPQIDEAPGVLKRCITVNYYSPAPGVILKIKKQKLCIK